MEALGGRLAGTLIVVAGVILAACAVAAVWLLLVRDSGDAWPASVPALSADELTAEPTDAWLTNGGTVYNQRYSPLDEIDASNVGRLRGVWMTDLDSGKAAKYSAEGQPIYSASPEIRTRSSSLQNISACMSWPGAGSACH